jgi:eukaryotic-like serine/threonine-protein kinase
MGASLVKPGAVLDGFAIGECVHQGGMATLWNVSHPEIAAPLLMKVPRVGEGEEPAAIVSFEMEQMILPRLWVRTFRPGSRPVISTARPMS